MGLQIRGWDGAPNYRWRKMVKGVSYHRSCEELGLPRSMWTKEASYRAWKTWLDSQLAAASADPVQEAWAGTVGQMTVTEAARIVDQVGIARAVLAAGKLPSDFDRGDIEEVIGVGPVDDGRAVELIHEVAAKLDRAPAADSSTKTQAGKFLEIALAKGIKPRTYEELKTEIDRMAGWLPGDVRKINEAVVTDYYLYLAGSGRDDSQKKKIFGFFKRFIRHLWGARLIDLPRNLDQHTFKVRPKAVKVHDLVTVRGVLAKLPDRLRLYALLGLNCGMLGVDIGNLRRSEIDFAAGTITRKRTKTADEPTTPRVIYRLWPETRDLLRAHLADHPTLALTSSHNTPLWDYRVVNGKTKEKDLVRQQWQDGKSGIPHKVFRSIGATLLESHDTHCRHVPLYLAHSPGTVASKHYSGTADASFFTALEWLRDQIFPGE